MQTIYIVRCYSPEVHPEIMVYTDTELLMLMKDLHMMFQVFFKVVVFLAGNQLYDWSSHRGG